MIARRFIPGLLPCTGGSEPGPERRERTRHRAARAAARSRGGDGIDPDGDALALVDRGDLAGAVRLLMKRYGTGMYRYCREELRDGALADDVHQQVFIEALRDLPRFQRRSTVRVWLFAIARHRVLDAAKKRRLDKGCVEDCAALEIPDDDPSPDEALDDARLHQALADAIAELPRDVRTALLLRYQQGFRFAEMASICEEQASTLCARVKRALPVLRRKIEIRLRARR
jgi:RNA polymerase sigma factor (sigma-70 family)